MRYKETYRPMANALIDNSEQFKLVKYIKKLVSRPECNHIMIAIGYCDIHRALDELYSLTTFAKLNSPECGSTIKAQLYLPVPQIRNRNR